MFCCLTGVFEALFAFLEFFASIGKWNFNNEFLEKDLRELLKLNYMKTFY